MHIAVAYTYFKFMRISIRSLVFPLFLISFGTVICISTLLVLEIITGEIPDLNKMDVAKTILSASLSFSALSLVVFSYSTSNIKCATSTNAKRPFRRLGIIVYFIITMGLVDSLFSATYVLYEFNFLFVFSLLLFLVIIGGVLIALTIWAEKDL